MQPAGVWDGLWCPGYSDETMHTAGSSCRSELFDSLQVYLNNKKRLQPIIGLGSIVECVREGLRGREALYVCAVCVCRLNKADMRIHIMGSLHRYNYIRARRPDLMCEWEEQPDLSNLAWPLMEIARTIEGQEGAGHVQSLKVLDAMYQKMETCSEEDVVTLTNHIRDRQGQFGPQSHPESGPALPERCPVQPQGIIPVTEDHLISHQATAQNHHEAPPFIQSSVVPRIRTDGWSHSPNSSFVDGYTGSKPLIGLHRVVECRSDNGRTYVFLCHCCRVRSRKQDVIDHLTSSSHLLNYLMESYPEQEEVLMTDLQSVAWRVEQEEGRVELEVINVPESLCVQLTGKSYHWCINMLCNGGTPAMPPKNKTTVKAVKAAQQTWAKTRRRKTRMGKTEFQVSLPLSQGAVLLKRTSLSAHVAAGSHWPSLDPAPPSEDSPPGCDVGPFTITNDHRRGETSSHRALPLGEAEEVDGYVGNWRGDPVTVLKSNQDDDGRGKKEQNVDVEINHNQQVNLCQDLNSEGGRKQNEGVSQAPSHRHRTYPDASYRREADFNEPWSHGISHSWVGADPRVSRDERRHERPHPCHQTCSGGVAPHPEAPRPNTEHAPPYPQRPPGPTHTHFTTTEWQPQSCMMQPRAHQTVHVGQQGTWNHHYCDGPWTKQDLYWYCPNTDGGAGDCWDVSPSNTFLPPAQALCYGHNFDF